MLTFYLSLTDGDKEKNKFIELYNRYGKLMHYLAKKIVSDDMLAEDAVQEAFIKIATHMDKIDSVESKKTKYYISTITKNCAISIIRSKNYNLKTYNIDDLEYEADIFNEWSNPILEKMEKDELINLAMELPDKYLEPLVLYYAYQHKMSEIAYMLGISRETAKKRVQRAKQMLIDRYREMIDNE